MKTTVLKRILITFALSVPFFVMAQDSEQTLPPIKKKTQTLKLSPTSFFANTFMLGYEKKAGKNSSIQVFGAAIANERETYNDGYEKVLGGSGELQFRVYLIPESDNLKGLYAAPYARFRYMKFEEKDPDNSYSYPYTIPEKIDYTLINYDGGVILGYQFIVKEVVVFDFFAGGGIKISESTKPDNSYFRFTSYDLLYQNYTGVTPKAGFRIGIIF